MHQSAVIPERAAAQTPLFRRLGARAFAVGESGEGALAEIAGRQTGRIPVVVFLGLLTSLFEGFGIGMLIPVVALMTGAGLPASVPGPVRAVADFAQGAGAVPPLAVIAGFILLMVVLKGAVQAVNIVLMGRIDSEVGHDVRTALSRRLLGLDFSFYLAHDASRLVKILSTDAWFGMDTVRARLEILVSSARLIVFAALLVLLNWQLFAGVLVAVWLLRLLHLAIEKRVRRLGNLAAEINQRLGKQMLVVINAARTIRVYGQQEAEQRRFVEASEGMRKSFLERETVAAWSEPLVELALALMFVGIVTASARLNWSLATLSAFLALLYRAQPQLSQLNRSRVTVASRRGSVRDIEWLLSQPGQASPPPALDVPVEAIDRAIEFRNVSYDYPNGAPGLVNASFRIEPETTVALIGHSGAGKSTIVNLICRLLRPRSGQILLDGKPIDEFRIPDWLQRIALAGQDIDLVGGTVAFNVAYGAPEVSRDEIVAAARAASAHGFIEALPGGYDSYVGEEGISLSAGQRQRIGLARALLRKPDLLILDEATNAVDGIAETEIMRLLAERSHFRTAVVISHRRSTLHACTDGIVLDGGVVREAGPIAALSYFAEMRAD